jgi:hypothetical protein
MVVPLIRKTMYALMNTGLHGSNGINPSVALRIYEAYVLPKLLWNGSSVTKSEAIRYLM